MTAARTLDDVSAYPGLTPKRVGQRVGGIAFIVLAVLCFGTLDTTTKVIAAVVPVAMAMWVRCLIQTVVTATVLWPARGASLFHTRRPGMHLARGLLLLMCSMIAYFSLRNMHVGEFTAIVMLTPLLITVVAASALRESVSWLRWLCVLGGFAGTMVVIRPGKEMFQLAALLPLVLVGANAAFQVLTSRLAKTDAPGTMHFYTGLVGLVLTTIALPFIWQALPIELWLVLGLMGTLGTLGHFMLIMAYTRAPVAVLTPYLYLQIAFAALGGWLVFSHVPDAWSLAGIALISLCGAFGTWLTGREMLAAQRREADESSIVAIAGADAH